MNSRNSPTEPRRSEYANQPEVYERDEPALGGKTGRDDGQGAVPGTAGADDVRHVGQNFEVTSSPDAFAAVCEAIDKAGLKTDLREITRIPKDTVDLDADSAKTVLKLMDMLDDHDDVQAVFSNADLPDSAFE